MEGKSKAEMPVILTLPEMHCGPKSLNLPLIREFLSGHIFAGVAVL